LEHVPNPWVHNLRKKNLHGHVATRKLLFIKEDVAETSGAKHADEGKTGEDRRS
jgi:hypothetical protein